MIKYAMAGGAICALVLAIPLILPYDSSNGAVLPVALVAAVVGFLWGTFLCWAAGRVGLFLWRTIRRIRLAQR